MWRDGTKGVKTRFNASLLDPPRQRDLDQTLIDEKVERGDLLQKARLRRYPSIDVDYDRLFAGKIEGDIDDGKKALRSIGFRNNPTAYVEVTEEHGPDEGSYSRQIVTETGRRFDLPVLTDRVTFLHRLKEQIHVTIYQVEDEVHFLAHRERSAWLQPGRHIVDGDVSARRGVRDFRDVWFDETGSELGGKEQVTWDTTH